jgi:hypothetical protein
MDLKKVQWRVEHEGISFLTIALPAFGKDFERCLDLEQVDRRFFQGFAWKKGLPLFLGGFLDLVFDRDSGVLLEEPSIDAILAIRQLTLMFGKISLVCSDARYRRAMDGYIECEKDVRRADAERSPQEIADFRRISALLFANSFTYADREIYEGNAVPKHGPGATADRLRGNGKYRQSTWPSRLEEIFPSGEFLLASWSYYDQLESIDILEPEAEKPVRVISVPKTLKTPRIIGIEPTAMQYAQQAILPILLRGLAEHGPSKDKGLLSHFLGFDDQVPNQELARRGSTHGALATLDLSEASDRVSNQLVREMLRNHKHLHHAVDASRSRKADVPGHGVVRLAKFASMGSALCFPMEAMVFLTLIFIGIERDLNTQLTLEDIQTFKGRVRVYGDDIIVPVEHVRSVVRALELFGARVNQGKSFWNGKFRESCGKEYYDGHDVSIVRVRQLFPTQRRHADRVISIVSLRNQLYFAGYWNTCKWLDEVIRDVIYYFPVVLPSSPVLGRHSFLGYETKKLCDKLHKPLVRGYVVSARIPNDPLDDMGALLKFFLKRGDEPSYDERHLLRAGRPVAVDIKLRMASAV